MLGRTQKKVEHGRKEKWGVGEGEEKEKWRKYLLYDM